MKSKIFLVLLTALAVGVLIVFGYRGNGVKTYPSYKTSSISGFRLTHKESNKIKWELLAEKTTFPEGEKEIFLENLIMTVNQERKFIVKGGSGVYNIKEKKLMIRKPVEIDIEGATLTTDSLVWNGEKGIVTTEDNIRFQGENFTIEGSGLSVKVKNQQIRILKDVKGIFYR